MTPKVVLETVEVTQKDEKFMSVTHEHMLKCTGMIYVSGTKDKNSVLRIGDEVVTDWPTEFEVLGVKFQFSDEEEIQAGTEFTHVLACYFSDNVVMDNLKAQESSPSYEELQKIIDSGVKPTHWHDDDDFLQ